MDDPGERTCYVCNLHESVTEELLKELFSQVGPLDTIVLRTNNSRDSYRYALIVFKHEVSVPFACEMLDRIELFNKQISVRPKQGTQQAQQYRTNTSVSAPHNPAVIHRCHEIMQTIDLMSTDRNKMKVKSIM